MSTQLDQIIEKAKSHPKERFTSLAYLLTPEFLKETWRQMNRRVLRGGMGFKRATLKAHLYPPSRQSRHSDRQAAQAFR